MFVEILMSLVSSIRWTQAFGMMYERKILDLLILSIETFPWGKTLEVIPNNVNCVVPCDDDVTLASLVTSGMVTLERICVFRFDIDVISDGMI